MKTKLKAFKIEYKDGRTETAIAENGFEVIRRYDLATKENIKAKVSELSGVEALKAFLEIRNKIVSKPETDNESRGGCQ
jgi:hypothetical protein